MADDLKKKLVQYGDKVLFGLFLVVLIAVAALTLLTGKAPEQTAPHTLPVFREPDKRPADQVAQVYTEFEQGGIPEAYVTGGFASDPDEIYPRAGEKACPRCGWIMKASARRCPSCKYMFEDDDDKDGMPNDWEDRYNKFDSPDRNKPDAEADPDGDGFSNMKEFLGGSNPEDSSSIPSPFRLVRSYRKPVEVRFKGYVVKPGGNVDDIDPDFWDLQMNYGRGSETAIIPLAGSYKGYKLWPVEKKQIRIDPGGGIPPRWQDIYVLTIQRPGQQPIRLVQDRWATTNETFIDLEVTQGRDTGTDFNGLTVGATITANGTRFEVAEMHDPVGEGPDGSKPFTVILKGSEGEVYRLSE